MTPKADELNRKALADVRAWLAKHAPNGVMRQGVATMYALPALAAPATADKDDELWIDDILRAYWALESGLEQPQGTTE